MPLSRGHIVSFGETSNKGELDFGVVFKTPLFHVELCELYVLVSALATTLPHCSQDQKPLTYCELGANSTLAPHNSMRIKARPGIFLQYF